MAHEVLLKYCNPCIREGVQSGTHLELCSAVHSEKAAIADANNNGYYDLSKACLWVAGKFPDGKRLIKSERGVYCTMCSRLTRFLCLQKLKEVSELDLLQVSETSYQYALKKKKRLSTAKKVNKYFYLFF